MTGLTEAATRLSAALDRLEHALSLQGEARTRQAGDATGNASLARERDGLLARIAALEEENRSLAGATEEVEGKLDNAIADIHAALGR